jgi:hypothetical protein
MAGEWSLFDDPGSTRIDLACPHCEQLFKVRLRKLQFGSELVCRLCRYEFSAREVSGRPEIQEALARMHTLVALRVRSIEPRRSRDEIEGHKSANRDHPRTRLKMPHEVGREEAKAGSPLLGEALQRKSRASDF